MCLLMEQMRDEAAEKSAAEAKLATWIADVKNFIKVFGKSKEEVVDALNIPDEYRPKVLAALE